MNESIENVLSPWEEISSQYKIIARQCEEVTTEEFWDDTIIDPSLFKITEFESDEHEPIDQLELYQRELAAYLPKLKQAIEDHSPSQIASIARDVRKLVTRYATKPYQNIDMDQREQVIHFLEAPMIRIEQEIERLNKEPELPFNQ